MTTLLAPKDTIDLIVTAAIAATITDDARDLIGRADRLGQQLWDANHVAVSYATDTHLTTPAYIWRPVFEILWQDPADDRGTRALQHALQIEQCRRFLEENSRHHPLWGGSIARAFLEQLGAAITAQLDGWPHTSSTQGDPRQYLGLKTTTPQWKREHGFRH